MRILSFLLAPFLALVAALSWYLPGAKRARQAESSQVTELMIDLGEAPGQHIPRLKE
ncbi:MAG: hypothetical protein KBA91_02325 [Candidatus Moranbacteria bacterium]|nr:hypothetical protein [Candidatus Moranbacteria bacterium]